MSCSGFESRRHSSAHMEVFGVKESFEWHKSLRFWKKALSDTSLWDFGIKVELHCCRSKSLCASGQLSLWRKSLRRIQLTSTWRTLQLWTRWSWHMLTTLKSLRDDHIDSTCETKWAIRDMALSLQVRAIEENVAESYLDFFSSSMLSIIIFLSAFQSIWRIAAAPIIKKDVAIMF